VTHAFVGEDCSPICGVCNRRKKPIGRDSVDNGLCDSDCPGYREAPYPCQLWFDEHVASTPEEGAKP
jgi:hypothetical protein